VRRTITEKFADPCVVPTVKHGGGSIMIWSCFGAAVGDLSRIDGILVKERYKQTLQRHAIPSGTQFATVQSGQKGIIWLARLVVVRAPPAVELGSMRYLRR
jgi:hypothetical protein